MIDNQAMQRFTPAEIPAMARDTLSKQAQLLTRWVPQTWAREMGATAEQLVTNVLDAVTWQVRELVASGQLKEAPTPASLIQAILHCLICRLIPVGGVLGHGYLVPRSMKVGKGPDATWATAITLIVGYRGLEDLVLRYAGVRQVLSGVVYQGDEYSTTMAGAGTRESIVRSHLPGPHNSPATPVEEWLYSYAAAVYPDGTMCHPELLSGQQLRDRRQRLAKEEKYGPSKGQKVIKGIAADWPDAWARKTAIRDLCGKGGLRMTGYGGAANPAQVAAQLDALSEDGRLGGVRAGIVQAAQVGEVPGDAVAEAAEILVDLHDEQDDAEPAPRSPAEQLARKRQEHTR